MIYVLRPQMPGLFEVIDAVLDGPPGYADGEAVRAAFGRDVLTTVANEGRALKDDELSTEAFVAWLKAHGFTVLPFTEVDSIVSADAVRNWNARIVTPAGVEVHTPPPSDVPDKVDIVGVPSAANLQGLSGAE